MSGTLLNVSGVVDAILYIVCENRDHVKSIRFDANRKGLWNESKRYERSGTGCETVSSIPFDCEHWECVYVNIYMFHTIICMII